ncbi:MAG: arabinofuranan 3-O-arabinosyltransferase [Thermoleophilaceae bacterium]|nr:arabinofuranan 3-O-arabinosyltransferase [Thermoleophilaceae bacterium]
MRRLTFDRATTLGFVALAYMVALWQRPGRATSDTKIDLHVNPGELLDRVFSVWTPTNDLGAVHSSQYTGYLWPTGPFFALLDWVGVSSWLAHRLWLGTLLALAAWGMLKLMDAFVGRPRGPAHIVAAAFYAFNPYTTVFTFRTTAILLGYVALPWLLVIVREGVRAVHDAKGWRDWRGWWAAAAFALVVTSAGGGINGAVLGWMLVGPLVLLVYEVVVRAVGWRDARRFLGRAAGLSLVASLWWIVPLLVHARYGVDFLQYTEGPRAIWNTNSATEVLRLMAYWTSYASIGFHGTERPLFSEEGTMLFNPFVVGASLLLPAIAVAGFVWSRRWRYGPFFMLILLVGVAIEVAGFPSGTPARHAMEWIYHEVLVLRFMRTTQKAAPLVAVGVAGLLGISVQLAWQRVRALQRPALGRVLLAGGSLALAALIALQALPLARGTAPDKQITWDRIPAAWTDAGHDLDRQLPANSRALVLPGQIFAFYTWGGTVDSIMPKVTKRPVAVRYETPYAEAHASDLLTTVDGLVQQQRLMPGQLKPLLGLMGVGSVITGSDDDIARSGAVDPALAAEELADQDLGRPAHGYGPVRALPPAKGDVGPARHEPEVRRYDLPPGRGLVQAIPTGPPTIVDGAAQGLAGLAAFGALPARRPLLYAGDLSDADLRRYAASGAKVVVTDSNRRWSFVPTDTQQSHGRVLAESEPLDKNSASIEPFPKRGSDAQTVTVLHGATYVRAPEGGGPLPFPERSAIHAFDGDPTTLWAAARYLRPNRRWIEVGFRRPRDVPYVDLLPVHDWRGIEREVDVNGVRAKLGPGTTRIQVNLHDVSRLRFTLTRVDQPQSDLRGSGGFREIGIPGVHLSETLRSPVVSARALAGRDLDRVALSYVFQRNTGDRPGKRDRHTGSPLLELLPNRQDSEKQIDRTVFAPAARSYDLDAWVRPSIDARDPQLDRLAGLRGADRFDSSSRFQNQPRYRASSAFDADPSTAWVSVWEPPSAPKPWLSWSGERPLGIDRLELTPAPGAVRRPTRVKLSWPGGETPALSVGSDGAVELPEPVRTSSFRLTVLEARWDADTTRRERLGRAVGVGSVLVPGLAPVSPPRSGPVRADCGSVTVDVGGRRAALRPRGTIEDLDAGRPLRAAGCDGAVAMGRDIQRIRSIAGPFSVDMLRLRSAAPGGLPAEGGGGRVADPGTLHNSSLDGVRVDLTGPSWLVLGQSYSVGWEATCDGRSLGEPRPINAYANGWLAPSDCHDVAFEFAPQATARLGYLISGLACLALLAFLVAGAVAGRRGAAQPDLKPWPDLSPGRMRLPVAAAISLAVTIPLALLLAKRTGVVIFPLLTLVLWRGIGPRLLTAGAALLLGLVVPIMYAVISPRDRGGFNFEYSVELMQAHWVGVGAFVLLIAACWRALGNARASQAGGPSMTPTNTARAEYSRKS